MRVGAAAGVPCLPPGVKPKFDELRGDSPSLELLRTVVESVNSLLDNI